MTGEQILLIVGVGLLANFFIGQIAAGLIDHQANQHWNLMKSLREKKETKAVIEQIHEHHLLWDGLSKDASVVRFFGVLGLLNLAWEWFELWRIEKHARKRTDGSHHHAPGP